MLIYKNRNTEIHYPENEEEVKRFGFGNLSTFSFFGNIPLLKIQKKIKVTCIKNKKQAAVRCSAACVVLINTQFSDPPHVSVARP